MFEGWLDSSCIVWTLVLLHNFLNVISIFHDSAILIRFYYLQQLTLYSLSLPKQIFNIWNMWFSHCTRYFTDIETSFCFNGLHYILISSYTNNKQELNWAKLSSSFASYLSKPNKVDPLQYLTIYVKIMCMNYILLLYYKMNKLF